MTLVTQKNVLTVFSLPMALRSQLGARCRRSGGGLCVFMYTYGVDVFRSRGVGLFVGKCACMCVYTNLHAQVFSCSSLCIISFLSSSNIFHTPHPETTAIPSSFLSAPCRLFIIFVVAWHTLKVRIEVAQRIAGGALLNLCFFFSDECGHTRCIVTTLFSTVAHLP